MRWTDLPPTPTLRTLAAWADERRASDPAGGLEAVVERACRRAAEDPPIVALAAGTFRAAWHHVAGSAVERGGLLLGEPLFARAGDATPAVVLLRTAIAALDDDATEFSLRLATGIWDAARTALAPGEVVVGWFHSHPNLGAFFSGTDRRTQAGFFCHPYSVGWVIDPVRREQAWFVGPRSCELPLDRVLAID